MGICGMVQFPQSFLANQPKLWEDCAFPKNLHTRKLGEIMVFHSVIAQDISETRKWEILGVSHKLASTNRMTVHAVCDISLSFYQKISIHWTWQDKMKQNNTYKIILKTGQEQPKGIKTKKFNEEIEDDVDLLPSITNN